MQIYEELDELTREATLFFADNLGLGMGFGIVAVSAIIKGVFIPIQLKMVLPV